MPEEAHCLARIAAIAPQGREIVQRRRDFIMFQPVGLAPHAERVAIDLFGFVAWRDLVQQASQRDGIGRSGK